MPYFVFDRGETAKISECCRLSFKLEASDLEDAKHPWRMRYSALQNITVNLPRLAFKAEGDDTKLNPAQTGVVGDMTSSRKVRVLDLPVEEAYLKKKRGEEVPEHMGNCLYLEWFSDFNGRVVIESVDYRTEITGRSWTMDEEQEHAQRETNMHAMGRVYRSRISATLPQTVNGDEGRARLACPTPRPHSEIGWQRTS